MQVTGGILESAHCAPGGHTKHTEDEEGLKVPGGHFSGKFDGMEHLLPDGQGAQEDDVLKTEK